MHTDGAQAVGKAPVSLDDLGVDLLSIAGHKLSAAKGVGALYIRRGTTIRPLLVDAGQERDLRPGTENVASIVGLGKAAELAMALLDTEPQRQQALREELGRQLAEGIPGLVRVSPAEGCLPNTLMVALPDRLGANLLDATPTIAASIGSACHSGVHTPAATLLAMGIQPDLALGALRLTLGRATTHDQILSAAIAIKASWHTYKAISQFLFKLRPDPSRSRTPRNGQGGALILGAWSAHLVAWKHQTDPEHQEHRGSRNCP